jgi:formate dehydrogenase major subunit
VHVQVHERNLAMTIGRRDLMKGIATVGGAAAVGELFVVQPSRAAELKRAGAKEFTTACNFCSCGCGMVGHVIDGKLVNLEGDPDHVVNEGALCVKGSAMLATHESPQRLRTPRYRAPGSDRWVEISWDEALDRLTTKLKAIRDATWVATEQDGGEELPVNRTDAIALLGGAQSTNEECYLWTKLGRLLGTSYVEHQARL